MKALPWLLVLVALVVAAVAANGERYAAGEARRLAAVNDSLRRVTRRVDSVYARDTLRLWRVVRATDTLTRTVEAWKHDTLRVVEYVQRADSAVQACVAVVQSCEARVAVRDARIVALESLNAATAARVAGERRAKWRTALVVGGVAYLAGRARVP